MIITTVVDENMADGSVIITHTATDENGVAHDHVTTLTRMEVKARYKNPGDAWVAVQETKAQAGLHFQKTAAEMGINFV